MDATTLLIISIKCGKSCICVTPRPIHECIRNLTFFYTRGSVYKPPVPYVNHLCNFHRFSQVAHIKNHLQKFWLWNLWKSFCIAVEFAYKIRIPINGVFFLNCHTRLECATSCILYFINVDVTMMYFQNLQYLIQSRMDMIYPSIKFHWQTKIYKEDIKRQIFHIFWKQLTWYKIPCVVK